MSHNEQKIGTAKPNLSGAITHNLNDISDVNITSIQDGQILAYNSASSNWVNSSSPTATAQYIWMGQGESNDYANTGNSGSINNGDAWYIYDSNPINTITGASITNVSSTDWIDYITLPAGQYIIDSQFFAEWTASGYIEVAGYRSTSATPTWSTNTSDKVSHSGYIGETISSYAVSNVLSGQFVISSSDVSSGHNRIRLQVVNSNNLKDYDGATNQGNTPAQYNYIHIRKVGS